MKPSVSHPYNTASEAWFFKARDIARRIVKTKFDLLKTLYTDKKSPKTHKEIGKVLVLPDYPDVDSNKLSSIISLAVQEAFTEKQYEKIRQRRKEHFDSLHGTIVGHKNLKKFLKKARSCWDTTTRWAKRQSEMKERWLYPWYEEEVRYLYDLLHNPVYQRKHPPYKGSPDYSKIANCLNKKFYKNMTPPVRNQATVSSYTHKHNIKNNDSLAK